VVKKSLPKKKSFLLSLQKSDNLKGVDTYPVTPIPIGDIDHDVFSSTIKKPLLSGSSKQ
jgi:hypothetical protein